MPKRVRNSGVPFNDLYGGKFVGKKYTKRNRGSFSIWTYTGVVLDKLNIRRKE